MIAHPTDKAVDALAKQIAAAWLSNAHAIYPCDADIPDPAVMANLASKAAWAFFLDVVEAAQKGKRQ